MNQKHLRNGKPTKKTIAPSAGKEPAIEKNSDEEAGTQFPCTNDGCDFMGDTIVEMYDHLAGGVCVVEVRLSMYEYVRKGNCIDTEFI